MAGAVKVFEADQESPEFMGPSEVARTEAKIEMGVRYEAGVPSPMEGAYYHEPMVVDGLVAVTRGLGAGLALVLAGLEPRDDTLVEVAVALAVLL